MSGKIFTIALILLSQSLVAVQAQSFQEWIRMVNANINEVEEVDLEVTVRLYGEKDEEVMYESTMEMQRDGAAFHYTIEDIEMMQNKQYQIMINHSYKTLILRNMNAYKDQTPSQVIGLDSILTLYDNPEVIKEDESEVVFKVNQNIGIIDYLELYIDKKGKRMKKLVYKTREAMQGPKGKTEMLFTEHPVDEKAMAELLDENSYVKIENMEEGKVKLIDKYKGYRLIK